MYTKVMTFKMYCLTLDISRFPIALSGELRKHRIKPHTVLGVMMRQPCGHEGQPLEPTIPRQHHHIGPCPPLQKREHWQLSVGQLK